MKKIEILFILVISCLTSLTQSPLATASEGNMSEAFRFIGTGKVYTQLVIGANLAPIYNGEYSLQIESYRTNRFGYNIAAGISETPKKGTLLKIARDSYSDLGKGYFFRAGADYQFTKNNGDKKYKRLIFEPFIGLRAIYSKISESRIKESIDPIASIILFEDYRSGNISVAISTGTAINFSKSLSLKAGIQFGRDIIENRIYSYGYSPGMGVDWGGLKTQVLAVLRYRIASGERKVDMTRRN